MPGPNIAILLCAGYGTRMGALTAERPKPLLRVAGRPLLDPLVDQIEKLEEIEAIHVVSNHRYAGAFEEWASRRRGSKPLILHDDLSTSSEDRLGAIGDLDFVLSRLDEIPAGALVAAGDNILRFGLGPFWLRFRQEGSTWILALEEKSRERLQRTGVLKLDGDRVLELLEKPQEPPSTWSSPACYCLARRALETVGGYLAEGGSKDEIGRFIAHLVATQEVRAHRVRGERLHVGHPEELERADQILASEDVLLANGEEAR